MICLLFYYYFHTICLLLLMLSHDMSHSIADNKGSIDILVALQMKYLKNLAYI